MSDIEHLQRNALNRVGFHRARAISWTIEESKAPKKSVALVIRFAILQHWDPEYETPTGQVGAWSTDWSEGWYVDHKAWVVGKEGELNAGAIERLAEVGLWDGDWDRVASPPPTDIFILDVKSEEYEGKAQIRAAWVNKNTDRPVQRGSLAPASNDLLESMRKRFPTARAAAGVKPSGTPAAPPRPAVPSPAVQPAVQQAAQPQTAAPSPTPATGGPQSSQPAVSPGVPESRPVDPSASAGGSTAPF